MTRRVRLAHSVVVAAPAQECFDALVDWPAQGRWMMLTAVTADGPAAGPGGRLTAVTGRGRVALVDTMEITGWDRPRRVEVLHTGRVVRGPGAMEVLPLPDGRTRVVWSEDLELPLGAVGRAGFAVLRPLVALGVTRSLARFAALVAAGQIGSG